MKPLALSRDQVSLAPHEMPFELRIKKYYSVWWRMPSAPFSLCIELERLEHDTIILIIRFNCRRLKILV